MLIFLVTPCLVVVCSDLHRVNLQKKEQKKKNCKKFFTSKKKTLQIQIEIFMYISTCFSSPPDKGISAYFCMFYYAVPMQAYLIFQAESTETETGKKACGLRKKEEII